MKYNLKIGKNVRILRKMHGLSQEKLAELINCNYKTICNLENDKNMPNLKQFINICDIFGIRLDSMLTDNLTKTKEFVPVDETTDEYPVFIKRIAADKHYSTEHIQNMMHVAGKLPKLNARQIKALRQLIDLAFKEK